MIQSKIIRQLANQGPCVIIGRCSDVIVEDAFRVFISSGLKKRVERILALEKEPDEDVKKLESRIRAIDASAATTISTTAAMSGASRRIMISA